MISLVKKRKYRGIERYIIKARVISNDIILPEGLPDFVAEKAKASIRTWHIDSLEVAEFDVEIKVKDNKFFSAKTWSPKTW